MESNDNLNSKEEEANNTWHVGKMVGMRTREEAEVVRVLRRSQRKAKGF